MGKHKPIYDPSTDCGDYVVAINCAHLKTTGKKMQQKMYYTHTTRPGSLKSMSMERLMEKWGGAEVLRRAVSGMLPKNRLRDLRLARLKGEFAGWRWRGVNRMILADVMNIAFEGHAHPYKKNILQFPNQRVKTVTQIPEVQATISPTAVEAGR
jgi:large subunit ribosomal protein L13